MEHVRVPDGGVPAGNLHPHQPAGDEVEIVEDDAPLGRYRGGSADTINAQILESEFHDYWRSLPRPRGKSSSPRGTSAP